LVRIPNRPKWSRRMSETTEMKKCLFCGNPCDCYARVEGDEIALYVYAVTDGVRCCTPCAKKIRRRGSLKDCLKDCLVV
jgi:hypothetical protein